MAGGGYEEKTKVRSLTGEIGGCGVGGGSFTVAREGGFGLADEEEDFRAAERIASGGGEGIESAEASGVVAGMNEVYGTA